MARTDPMMHIRVTPKLKAWLDERAAENRRTLNAQVAFDLEFHMKTEETAATAGKQTAAVSGH